MGPQPWSEPHTWIRINFVFQGWCRDQPRACLKECLHDLPRIKGAELQLTNDLDKGEMFDKVDEIMDAIDRLQYDMPQDESDEEEESDPELDGADREALQAMP